jgi:nucleoside-diphosphate-sugar epimerase
MESYCIKNYINDKLVILRFPIILGANDYTNRTNFYVNKIKNRNQINPININNKSCYIFTKEAANSIFNFINNENYGIFNISYNALSEFDLIKFYCNYFNFKIEELVNSSIELSQTPFSSNYDFIVDNNKYINIFPMKNTFEKALSRELSKI